VATGLVVGLRTLIYHSGLIVQLTRRDIEMRYKNSVLGTLWLIGQPLIQLMLYGFVFQIVLRSRWGVSLPNGREVPFGLMLFVGIMLHSLLADTLVRGPALIVSNTSYVKRVIFPLEILPLVNVASSFVGIAFGFVILVCATFYFSGHIPVGTLLIPIPLALLTLLTLGLGWLFSALGVFFRDLNQLSTSISTILLFTAPICYPAEMVPLQFRWLLSMNPLTIPVNCVRDLLFTNNFTGWRELGIYAIYSLVIATIGFVVFQRMRAGFADAI